MVNAIVGEIIFYNLNADNFVKKSIIRTIYLAIIATIIGTYIFNILYEDPSFKSKLYILDLAQNVGDLYTKTKLYGLGYGNSEESLGIFPHNFFLLYYLELGIVGLSVKLAFLLFILFKSKFSCYIVILPYLVAVMSATGYGTHYLYIVLALITLLSYNKINGDFCTYTYLQR